MKRKEKEIICNNHKAILHQITDSIAKNDIRKYGELTVLLNAMKDLHRYNLIDDSTFYGVSYLLYIREGYKPLYQKYCNNKIDNNIIFDSDYVNTNNLLIGMEIRDYQTLCELLGEKTKTGKARILQMNNWKRYFDYEKIKYSNSYIVLDIYPEPLPKEHKDYRNGLFVNEFKVLILTQLLQAEINDSGSIIYQTTFREIIEKMNIINGIFFDRNTSIEKIAIQEIKNNDFAIDNNEICRKLCKKAKLSYQKFYSIVYDKLKDNIRYALGELEKDNMIKVNYYNTIDENNEIRIATKNEEATITEIQKNTANYLGFRNSHDAMIYAFDRYNHILKAKYKSKGWNGVYYKIEIIASADNLKRHINEYTALNTIQSIYELTDTDIAKYQNKSNSNFIVSLRNELAKKQLKELDRIRDNNSNLSEFTDNELKMLLSFGSGMYNNSDYIRMYDDLLEFLIKNN